MKRPSPASALSREAPTYRLEGDRCCSGAWAKKLLAERNSAFMSELIESVEDLHTAYMRDR